MSLQKRCISRILMPGTILADIQISSPCTNVLHSPPAPDASLSDSTLIFSSSRAELIEATLSEEDTRFLYSHGCLGLNVSRFFTERIVEGDLLTLFTRRRFCSLPVGHNTGILEFFGADLHLDFCTRGCPTPLSASHRATSLTPLSLAGLRYSERRCKRKTSTVPSHTYKLRVQSSPKSV